MCLFMTYFTAKIWLESIFTIYGLKNYVEPSDLVTKLVYQVFSNFSPSGGYKQSAGGSQQSSLPAESFFQLFYTWLGIWTWNLVYTSGKRHGTSSVSFIMLRFFNPLYNLK